MLRRPRDPLALTPGERDCWSMHQDGLTNREIARLLNTTVSNISTRLNVARHKVTTAAAERAEKETA